MSDSRNSGMQLKANSSVARGTAITVLVFALLWFAPLFMPLSVGVRGSVHGAVFLSTTVVASVLCAWAARNTKRHERAGWALLAVGSCLGAARQLYALVTGIGVGSAWPVGHSANSALWGATLLALLAATLSFIESPHVTPLERVRRGVDFALLAFFISSSVFAFMLFPTIGRHPGVPLGQSLVLAASLVFSLSLLGEIVSLRPRIENWLVPYCPRSCSCAWAARFERC